MEQFVSAAAAGELISPQVQQYWQLTHGVVAMRAHRVTELPCTNNKQSSMALISVERLLFLSSSRAQSCFSRT